MDDIDYELRYVAYLDLLGFKELVNSSVDNKSILNRINLALDYIGKIQYDNYNGMMPMVDLGKQVTVFSDSIVISYNGLTPGGGFFVLQDLIFICISLLQNRIPVRGGVTIGSLIHNERKCFGPAMVEAYWMESEKAKVPRILINPQVLEQDLDRPYGTNSYEFEKAMLQSLIKEDPDDNQIFLDYMNQHDEFNKPREYNEFIVSIKEYIEDELKQHVNEKEVYKKYEWLKWYYNQTVGADGETIF